MRFMETEALQALRQAQLALAQASVLPFTACGWEAMSASEGRAYCCMCYCRWWVHTQQTWCLSATPPQLSTQCCAPSRQAGLEASSPQPLLAVWESTWPVSQPACLPVFCRLPFPAASCVGLCMFL